MCWAHSIDTEEWQFHLSTWAKPICDGKRNSQSLSLVWILCLILNAFKNCLALHLDGFDDWREWDVFEQSEKESKCDWRRKWISTIDDKMNEFNSMVTVCSSRLSLPFIETFFYAFFGLKIINFQLFHFDDCFVSSCVCASIHFVRFTIQPTQRKAKENKKWRAKTTTKIRNEENKLQMGFYFHWAAPLRFAIHSFLLLVVFHFNFGFGNRTNTWAQMCVCV